MTRRATPSVGWLLGFLTATLAACSDDASTPGSLTDTTATSSGDVSTGMGSTESMSSASASVTTSGGTSTATTGASTSTVGTTGTGTTTNSVTAGGMGGAPNTVTTTQGGTDTSASTGSAAETTGVGGSVSTGSTGGSMPSAGCGQPPPASDRYSIDVGGEMREYILAVPDDYDANTPYRLVFGWHPLGGSAQQVAGGGYYGLEGQAQGAAIFVAAEGLPFQGNNLGWANTNGRDLDFLDAMLERFRAELCIDDARIFSTGFSFGGMMSFAAGCAMDSPMRAIAPMAGNIQVSGCDSGTQPVAVMGFHGDDDTVVSIDGGRQGRDRFVERNQCTQEASPVQPSWCDGLSQNNQPCSCVSYQGCTEGYPVIWCEFNGPHTPAPNSAETIWDFFAGF